MGLFSKAKSRDDIIAEGIASAAAEAEAAASADKKDDSFNSGNPKLDMQITMIKAQLESFGEVRKANSERFSRLSEQMGELRGMIMDTNKTMSKIEVSATKAIDLVESVQPEKLMIEIRKQEGKMESLKANIESNEAMMHDIMEELKKMRAQMNFYKGIEQVTKLNDEVKNEILEIKKVEATIERHADKGETIFLDLEKKMANFDQFEKKISEVEDTSHGVQQDFDKMKLQIMNKAEKKEFLGLMDKFSEFEKHTGDVLKLLDERSKSTKVEIRDTLDNIKEQMRKKHGIVISDSHGSSRLPADSASAESSKAPGAAGTGSEGDDPGKGEQKASGEPANNPFSFRRIISKSIGGEEEKKGEENKADEKVSKENKADGSGSEGEKEAAQPTAGPEEQKPQQ